MLHGSRPDLEEQSPTRLLPVSLGGLWLLVRVECLEAQMGSLFLVASSSGDSHKNRHLLVSLLTVTSFPTCAPGSVLVLGWSR